MVWLEVSVSKEDKNPGYEVKMVMMMMRQKKRREEDAPYIGENSRAVPPLHVAFHAHVR